MNFERQNTLDWLNYQKELFGDLIPTFAEWNNLKHIVDILQRTTKFESLIQISRPNGTYFEPDEVSMSYEENCIEIRMESLVQILMPSKLLLISYDGLPQHTWLLLETLPIAPVVDEQYLRDGIEDLIEVAPKKYLSNYEEHNGFSNNYRHIRRGHYGKFLITKKSEPYFQKNIAEEGLFNKLSISEFKRVYLEWLKSDLRKKTTHNDLKVEL
jgi:hypothetical protein